MPRNKITNGVEIQLTSEEEKEIELEAIQVKKQKEEYAKVKYKDDRRPLYPEIGDQLDDLFKQGVFSEEMYSLIQKVKTENPKPD